MPAARRPRLPHYMTGPTRNVLRELGTDSERAAPLDALLALAYRLAAKTERQAATEDGEGFTGRTMQHRADDASVVVLALVLPFDREETPLGDELLDAVREVIRQRRWIERFGRPPES